MNPKFKNHDTSVILIDEEEDSIFHPSQKKDNQNSGIAQRILNKQQLPSGQVKYLVKWQGSQEDEATWEVDLVLREKHNELIQDYEFYVLTGEHLEEPKLDKPKPTEPLTYEQLIKQKHSKRAIKCAGRTIQSYALEDQKSTELQSEGTEREKKSTAEQNDSHEPRRYKKRQKQVDKDKQRRIALEQYSAEVKHMPCVQNAYEMNYRQRLELCKLKKSFAMITQNLNSNNAGDRDKIESVQLSTIDDELRRFIFTIDWKTRNNGERPNAQYYSYQQIAQMCPTISLKFLENQLFELNDESLNIKFSCQGQNEEDRHNLIFQAINPNRLTKIEAFRISQIQADNEAKELNLLRMEQEDVVLSPEPRLQNEVENPIHSFDDDDEPASVKSGHFPKNTETIEDLPKDTNPTLDVPDNIETTIEVVPTKIDTIEEPIENTESFQDLPIHTETIKEVIKNIETIESLPNNIETTQEYGISENQQQTQSPIIVVVSEKQDDNGQNINIEVVDTKKMDILVANQDEEVVDIISNIFPSQTALYNGQQDAHQETDLEFEQGKVNQIEIE